MANTVTAFEQGTMELENKFMELDFDLGQDVVKDALQLQQQQLQQQPRSASANEMIVTNDDELNEFLACNTAVEFDEPDTENLHEKDPKTKMKSEKWIEIEKLNEIEELNVDDLENGPENEKLLEKDPKTKNEI